MNSVPLYIVAILIWERLIAWCEKSRGNSTSCFPAHYHHLSILKISRLLNACTCMVCICAFTIPIPTRLSDGYYFKVTVVHVCLTHMSDMVLTSFCSHLFPGDCAFKVYTHVAMSAFGLFSHCFQRLELPSCVIFAYLMYTEWYIIIWMFTCLVSNDYVFFKLPVHIFYAMFLEFQYFFGGFLIYF